MTKLDLSSCPRTLLDFVPNSVREFISSGYFRYKSIQANRDHKPPTRTVKRQPNGPNHVVVLLIDALRPDSEPDIPMTFDRGVTPGTWTFPAVTSIHTGTYPHEHEAVAHTHPDDDSYVIPEQATPDLTLPGVFEAAGYDTYAGLAFMTPFLAVDGWYETHRVYADVRAERVVDRYEKWRRDRERTFAYLHLGDLHAPIEPPQEYIERHNIDTSIRDLTRLIRYTDDYDDSWECRHFRSERLKLYHAALDYVEDILEPFVKQHAGDTTFLIAGDHGEAHWEHYELDQQFTDSRPNYGVGHGGTPFDMVARVPVAVQTPDGDLTPQAGHASLRDIPATLCREAIKSVPFPGCEWQTPIPENRIVFCEATRYGAERKASYRGERKVIHSETDDATVTARLTGAAGETFDAPGSDVVRKELLDALPNYWRDGRINSQSSRMVEEQLSALGYT